MPCSIFSFILCNALPNIYNLRLYPRKTKGKLWISTFQPVLTVWLKIIVKIFFNLFFYISRGYTKAEKLRYKNSSCKKKQNVKKKRLAELSNLVSYYLPKLKTDVCNRIINGKKDEQMLNLNFWVLYYWKVIHGILLPKLFWPKYCEKIMF